MDAARTLKACRLDAGLTLRDLARRAHTSAATLSRYEKGSITPGVGTLERILNAANPARRRWLSLDDVAAAIADALADDDETWAWKIVGEVLDDEHGSDARSTLALLRRPPGRTGDARADACVAALCEYIALRRGLPTPLWLHEPRICRPFWFVTGGLHVFDRQALFASPPSFASRGIYVLPSDLRSA